MSTKLLVIDDNPGITKVIAMVAARLGYITQTVNEPRHAIDVFLEFRPDVTMVDMVMPEHDGIDVLNDLLLSGIPTQLVLMSGFADAYLRWRPVLRNSTTPRQWPCCTSRSAGWSSPDCLSAWHASPKTCLATNQCTTDGKNP